MEELTVSTLHSIRERFQIRIFIIFHHLFNIYIDGIPFTFFYIRVGLLIFFFSSHQKELGKCGATTVVGLLE